MYLYTDNKSSHVLQSIFDASAYLIVEYKVLYINKITILSSHVVRSISESHLVAHYVADASPCHALCLGGGGISEGDISAPRDSVTGPLVHQH